jgi:WD40 repeat protein
VNVFADDPSVTEAEPTKTYSGAGNSVHRGHEGDVITITYHDPNWLATGSVDGAIVVWNLEAGNIRFALREPFIHLRHQEEKPVEKVLFMKEPGSDKMYLLSCHADGCIRFWDMSSGVMENEVNTFLKELTESL